MEGIKEVMQQIWDGLTLDYPQKLFNSMPRRMQVVINANGGPTKY